MFKKKYGLSPKAYKDRHRKWLSLDVNCTANLD